MKTSFITVEQVYEHEGVLVWECRECRAAGSKEFRLRSKHNPPRGDDYDRILITIEVEHSMTGCKGTPEMLLAQRHRFVEHREPS